VLVLGTDGNLWLEHAPFGVNVPPTRELIDGNVQAFQALDNLHGLVLGTDGNLWLEQARFGAPPSLSFAPSSLALRPGLEASVSLNLSSVFPTDVTVTLSPANANIFLDAQPPGAQAMVIIPRGDTSAPLRIVGVRSGNSSVTASAAGFQNAVLPITL
jgi:hypothetical protein